MCPGAAFKAGFGCNSGPLTPLPVRIPCAWAFLCTEHQAGSVRCGDGYSWEGSGGGAVGFLGSSGWSFAVVRVVCISVQCLNICTTNQDTVRMLVFCGFYSLLLFNYRIVNKEIQSKSSPALKFLVWWNHFMQVQTKPRLKILWFLVHLLIWVDFNGIFPLTSINALQSRKPAQMVWSCEVTLAGNVPAFDNPSIYSSQHQGIQCWKVPV